MAGMAAGDRLDDRALVRRQVRAAAKALMRPRAYLGAAKELALSAFHLATYPLGMTAAEFSLDAPPPPRRGSIHPALEADASNAEVPVVLVHGYVHNRSAFLWMTRALRRAGFRHVHGLNYNPLSQDIPHIAQMLAVEVDQVLAATGAKRCMVVGHSMGGVVARYYVQVLGGHHTVDTVITLASPHRGTYTAHVGLGHATDLKPRSELMRTLEETARPGPVRWIAYYTDLDFLIAPAISAKLVHPALQATNIRLRDTGHLSLLLSGEAMRSIIDHLADRELGWTGDRPRPVPADTPTSARFRQRRDQRDRQSRAPRDAAAAESIVGQAHLGTQP
jgi:triacylglycerol lipase